MRKVKLFFRNQKGYLTIIAAFLVVFIGFLGTTIAYMMFSSSMSSVNFSQGTKALYLAEAGIEKTTRYLLTPTFGGASGRIACGAVTGDGDLTNASFGPGTFTVTTLNSSPIFATDTLNGALTSAATTITVDSTSGFAPSGRIMIDKELISYNRLTATTFTGATRGVDGTTAVAHIDNTPMGQYQCSLESNGGIPNLTSPLQRREIQNTVQLQDGWTVGDDSSSNYRVYRWNRSTELTWNNGSFTSGTSRILYGVYMLSYADGWAVGENGVIFRWNGSSWSLNTTISGNPQMNSVFCNTSNDCHAVGNSRTLRRWNGSTWTTPTISGGTTGSNMNTVHCTASNNCWAMGAGNFAYDWDGSTWTANNISSLTVGTIQSAFCNSSSDCWAVGNSNVFARYTGGSWSNYSTGMPNSTYRSVFCNSSSDCWAVGNNTTGPTQELIVHWDGTGWTRFPGPSTNRDLYAVECANTNDCWAVGQNSEFVHWNGTSWTTFTTSGLASVILRSISLIYPHSQPKSVWQEIFA